MWIWGLWGMSVAQTEFMSMMKYELLNNNYGYAFQVDEYLCQIQGDNAHENIIKQTRAKCCLICAGYYCLPP